MAKSNGTCGWPTAKGTGCKHPPTGPNGRCWLHEEDAENIGRPSKFTDELAMEAIDAASKGFSKKGCARAAGVGESAIFRWLKKNPTFTNEAGERQQFRPAFRRARHRGERVLVRGPLTRPDEIDGQHARFLLSTSYGYTKTERREHAVDSDAELGPIMVVEEADTVKEPAED